MLYSLSPGFFRFLVFLGSSSVNGLTLALAVTILSGLLNDTTKNVLTLKNIAKQNRALSVKA